MNYLDYKAIMKDEGLTLPEVGKYCIDRAMWCQKIIKGLEKQGGMDAQIKEHEEQKIGWILSAIDWARLAKQAPDVFAAGDKLMKRMKRK